MTRRPFSAVPLALALVLGQAAMASADPRDDIAFHRRSFASPERFALELRGASFAPQGDAAFERAFDATFDGAELMLGLELDAIVMRVPYVGLLGVGASLAQVSYDSKGFAAGTNDRVDEETSLELIPLSVMATLRIDVLARQLHVPFVVHGKLGADFVFWNANTGDRDDADGLSLGLRWAVGLALELDFFEPRAARALDEEWGINHSFLFAERFGSTAGGDSLPLDGAGWAFGLGFVF